MGFPRSTGELLRILSDDPDFFIAAEFFCFSTDVFFEIFSVSLSSLLFDNNPINFPFCKAQKRLCKRQRSVFLFLQNSTEYVTANDAGKIKDIIYICKKYSAAYRYGFSAKNNVVFLLTYFKRKTVRTKKCQ